MICTAAVERTTPCLERTTPFEAFALVSLLVACSGDVNTPGSDGPDDPPDANTPSSDAGPVSRGDGGTVTMSDAGNPPMADGSTTNPGPDDAGPAPTTDFREVDGLVAFEAEHYFEQVRATATEWLTFQAGQPDPEVQCVTNTACTGANRPECNEHPNCDGDDVDPSDASGETYVEALPDRRRTDDEANTGGDIGVVNNPDRAPTLRYRVHFTQTGRYYVWVHAAAKAPPRTGCTSASTEPGPATTSSILPPCDFSSGTDGDGARPAVAAAITPAYRRATESACVMPTCGSKWTLPAIT